MSMLTDLLEAVDIARPLSTGQLRKLLEVCRQSQFALSGLLPNSIPVCVAEFSWIAAVSICGCRRMLRDWKLASKPCYRVCFILADSTTQGILQLTIRRLKKHGLGAATSQLSVFSFRFQGQRLGPGSRVEVLGLLGCRPCCTVERASCCFVSSMHLAAWIVLVIVVVP